MRLVARSIAFVTVMSILFYGPLAPLAVAQSAQHDDMTMMEKEAAGNPAYDVGAGIANVVYVPGKAIVCTVGVVGAMVLLTLTAGSAYRASTELGEQGCGGKWLLKGDDLRPNRITEDMEHPGY
jgi:hypothetical protein